MIIQFVLFKRRPMDVLYKNENEKVYYTPYKYLNKKTLYVKFLGDWLNNWLIMAMNQPLWDYFIPWE